MPSRVYRWSPRHAALLAYVALLLVAAAARPGELAPGDAVVPPTSLRELAQLRVSAGATETSGAVGGRRLSYRGRPAVEITGRAPGGEGGAAIRDFAFVDLATGRVVAYAYFPNASTRQTGEAIISLSEVSTLADRLAREILPGFSLALAGIRRHRPAGLESVYYEARYAPPPTEVPFFEPPVRLLLNASTGRLFRVDVDPEVFEPMPPPRLSISRQAAERIASVSLRGRDLAASFGQGATLGAFGPAELFTVRPNHWLDVYEGDVDTRARVAWVVPFRLSAGGAPGPHSLFVDAATGRLLGGLAAPAAVR